MEPLLEGTVLAGRYRLDVKLGEGGMGVVWAAMHVVTRQHVALKLILPATDGDGARVVKRFMREARAASAVRHPNVVAIYDVMELDADTPMMVMELLHGETLGERLHRAGRLPLDEIARVLLPVVSALGTAHALGIVHRDIKPDNIFLANTPEGVCVKVLDFGIAKLSETHEDAATNGTLTATNAIVGTPQYMAPEQIFAEKDIDHRADTWALGVIAYECITGARPTEGSNVGQVMKIIATQAIVPIAEVAPDVPADVASLITSALKNERDLRPSLHDVAAVFSRYTDVHVRSFAEPQAPITLTSGASLPPNDSGGHGAPITNPSLGTAPTVASGERLPTSPTAATLEAGVTQLDAPRMPPQSSSRWLAIVLALVAVATTSALTVSLVRTRAPITVAAPPTAIPSVTPAASASAVKEREEITGDAAASVATAPALTTHLAPISHPSASAPAPVPTKRPSTPDHGGVVETVPY